MRGAVKTCSLDAAHRRLDRWTDANNKQRGQPTSNVEAEMLTFFAGITESDPLNEINATIFTINP